LGNIFAYSLVGNIDGEDVDFSISSPYTIENLSWSTDYNLEIHTSSEHGESFSPLEFSIGEEGPPGEVLGLLAEAGEASIALSWDSADNSSTYKIYLDGDSVSTTHNTSEVVSNLNTKIDFEFQVSGVNSEGFEGEKSALVIVQVLPVPPVTEIQFSSGAGQVTFSWLSPDSYAGDSTYTFLIFDESDSILEENYASNTYVINNLGPNEQRCIKIAAEHQFGVAEPSESICASPILSEVEGLTLFSGEGFVTLNWNHHPDAGYYNIYRDDSLIEEIFYLDPGAVYDDMDLQSNTSYSYAVVALDVSLIDGIIFYTEGAKHDPVSLVVTPLPLIHNL
jgi:hypothetical protein